MEIQVLTDHCEFLYYVTYDKYYNRNHLNVWLKSISCLKNFTEQLICILLRTGFIPWWKKKLEKTGKKKQERNEWNSPKIKTMFEIKVIIYIKQN